MERLLKTSVGHEIEPRVEQHEAQQGTVERVIVGGSKRKFLLRQGLVSTSKSKQW